MSNDIAKKFITDGMDFERYAYFSSKAKNFSIIYKARVEELLSTGEKRVAKDDNGKEMVGERIEFHNGIKRLEKTKENEAKIKFLRDKCEKEKTMPLRSQQLKEIIKPERVYTESETMEMLKKKDEEIKKLKEEKEKNNKKGEVETENNNKRGEGNKTDKAPY